MKFNRQSWIAAIRAIQSAGVPLRDLNLGLKSPQFTYEGWRICLEHQRLFNSIVINWLGARDAAPAPPVGAAVCPPNDRRKKWMYRAKLAPHELAGFLDRLHSQEASLAVAETESSFQGAVERCTKPKVYLETTVLSYLTAWPSRDIVIAAHQQVTRDWWKTCPGRFEVTASELVVQEASEGDEEAARARLAILRQLPLLELSEAALDLAHQLVARAALPTKATDDALHLAIAATNGVQYLVTWNCRHLANATMREQIEAACRAAGYRPPMICTPEELLETTSDD